jgi:hypothetical protein
VTNAQNFVGFRVLAEDQVDSWKLADNDLLTGTLTSVCQQDSRRFLIVVEADGGCESAVLKSTAMLWDLLENEGIEAELECAFYDDTDCTSMVDDAVAARRGLLSLEHAN